MRGRRDPRNTLPPSGLRAGRGRFRVFGPVLSDPPATVRGMRNRSALPIEATQVVWQAAARDSRARAPVAMMLLAGLRPREVCVARWDGLLLRVAGRRVPAGRVCAAALDHVRGTAEVIGSPLLPRATVVPLVQLVRAVARQAGVDAGATDLRHAAIRAAFDAHLPAEWICGYFGTAPPRGPLPEGWDDTVASVLEDAFT